MKGREFMIENWLQPYLNEFISNTGLPEEDSEDLFNDFATFFSSTLLHLDSALNNKDFVSISNYAHQLKGAAGSLLIEPVFNLAVLIENASKLSDEDECIFQLKLLKQFNI